MSKGCSLLIVSLSIPLLVGCVLSTPEPTAEPTSTPVPSSPLTDAFPGADAVPGWTLDGDLEVFDSETIFGLVNGQADFFFAYGFEQVAVRRYKNAEGVVLDIHIWQLAAPEDAYGLFTASVAGEPAGIGNEGDTDPGRRLVFWQERYVAQLFSRKDIPDADLRAFAEAVSAALPAGGERPPLVDRLPAGEMPPRLPIFFHEELSIQNEVWLGGENILGLSPDTDGVLAHYLIGGTSARLLLIAYPDAGAASAGLAALQGGEIEGLVAAEARENLLGAVFGEVDEATASALLEEALK
ncbi:MAG: hypothetical protein JW918_11480 [Anaerolineae bacterium]|nr:hypothetical protein [Anaerolineae bacterium]